ncbi:hypothetical protein BDP27DRAFT_1317024 [Rhodocollybia butyracea]|uniref:F-box domain-containing protein n=1 Tax=Rhodocollybia butyracea TaxID=206335 RepID=A0A9P5UCR3_9AGAR|nr:hypothetical protein BDP27DRAFT_1317024 [Rhodocollybia butyracea]
MDLSMSTTTDPSLIYDSPRYEFFEDDGDSINTSLDAYSYAIEPLPPAVNALLKTNEAPLHFNILQSERREAETVLSDLNSRLEKMKAEVAQFTIKRDHVISMIETYRNVLHPIRRTPPEVLLEIFSYCVDFVDTDRPEMCLGINSLDTRNAPWNLGQVCKYWRSIVLECPRLWCSLSIDLSKLQHADTVKRQKLENATVILLSHYLRRSKDCPLTIAVFSHVAMHPLLSILCASSHRWYNVLLSLPAEGFAPLTSMRGCLPKLKLLHLRNFVSLENIWSTMPMVDAFEYTPNLLGVRAHEIPNIATRVLLPWDQISHCSSNYTPNGDLRHATLLCAGYGPSLSITPLKHSFLTCLTVDLIRRSSPDLIGQLLGALTLPSLRSLRLSVSSRHFPRPDVRPIVRLIERSNCSLIKMRLKGFETSVEQDDSPFRSLMTAVQNSIQILCLENFPNSLLSALMATQDPDDPPLLPLLRHLRVSGICPVELDQILFVTMVESRVKYTKFMALVTSSQFVLTNPEAQRRLDALSSH